MTEKEVDPGGTPGGVGNPPWRALSLRRTGPAPNPHGHGEGSGKWKLVTRLSSARIRAGVHKATSSPRLKTVAGWDPTVRADKNTGFQRTPLFLFHLFLFNKILQQGQSIFLSMGTLFGTPERQAPSLGAGPLALPSGLGLWARLRAMGPHPVRYLPPGNSGVPTEAHTVLPTKWMWPFKSRSDGTWSEKLDRQPCPLPRPLRGSIPRPAYPRTTRSQVTNQSWANVHMPTWQEAGRALPTASTFHSVAQEKASASTRLLCFAGGAAVPGAGLGHSPKPQDPPLQDGAFPAALTDASARAEKDHRDRKGLTADRKSGRGTHCSDSAVCPRPTEPSSQRHPNTEDPGPALPSST